MRRGNPEITCRVNRISQSSGPRWKLLRYGRADGGDGVRWILVACTGTSTSTGCWVDRLMALCGGDARMQG